MTRDELEGWLRLSLTPGVGNQSARRLLAAFGLPAAVFDRNQAALQQVVSAAQAAALSIRPEGLDAQLDATLGWLRDLSSDEGAACKAVVTLGDPRYPAPLLELSDPPLLLYFHGAASCLAQTPAAAQALARCFAHSVAIVGSRNPTGQGLVNARQFAGALAQAGLTVVSCMALGIDGAAHEGALDAAQGLAAPRLATVAVVGTGLDRVYPKQHLALARRIARHGLLLSEYPIGTPPLAENFPKRNRIIAALSRGTVVVEAALKSGSLITAREATEQGREVFAIPGSIHSTQSRGCHALIRQGAKLVESAQDVLEELRWEGGAAPESPASEEAAGEDPSGDGAPHAEGALLRALGYDPLGLDALQARTGLDTARLQAELMALELEGHVVRLPGGLFQRISQA